MTDYLKDLIEIPERVQSGDFVLNLSSGLQDSAIKQTLRDYVVTPQLAECFENALSFIKSTVEGSQNRSKGAYLHGSFGSGKSHFMAVLHLLLQGNADARAIGELASSVDKHDDWLQRHNILLVPYHMIGEASIEAGVLGGYARHIAKLHPEAPVPGFYLSESLFRDAASMRGRMGDEDFFAAINAGTGDEADDDGWGEVSAGWDALSFEAAVNAADTDSDRARLVGDLIGSLFTTYQQMASTQGGGFVDFDTGLRIMTEHAKALGYSAVVLFLDELILWLASRLSDQAFISTEVQKVVKLVEQSAQRALPMASFIARQRDLRDFVGDQHSGAEQEALSDSLKYWEGRFHTIVLKDGNLPTIAEQRLLRPKSEAARLILAQAFEKTVSMRDETLSTLLTNSGDRDAFQKLYPFSPVLVQALVALSSALQRERTALKVMLMLLVEQRETLKLGEVIPVGDLYDVIASEAQPFSEQMRRHFDNAKKLLQNRLIPLLEAEHNVTADGLMALPADNQARINYNNDMRLLKTLLLAALVPEIESFKQLNSTRLAALNHGTIKSPIPGREAGSVLKKCRSWAGQVGEIKISDDSNPTIGIQLSGVDTDSILANAQINDNPGNRRRLIKEMVFKAFGITDQNQLFVEHEWLWRGSKRQVDVVFQNIWEISDNTVFEATNDRWKLIVDFPFDEGSHTVSDDVARIEAYQSEGEEGQTLCWLPYFFSQRVQQNLGKLVVLQEILKSDDSYASACSHLSPQDRSSARNLLENQRSQLQQQINEHLMAAYGVTTAQLEALDAGVQLETQIVSLQPGFRPQLPNGTSMANALTGLLDQALSHQYPEHPAFGAEVRVTDLAKVLEQLRPALTAENGRVEIERSVRPLMRQLAEPLGLGGLNENVFVFSDDKLQHLTREVAKQGGNMTVAALRAAMDQPLPKGLPVEVQNLLILLFAEAGHYAFQLHGGPVEDASLKRIDDNCELIKQAMAEPAQWRAALKSVATLFGGIVPELQTANNQKKLQGVVQDEVAVLLLHCNALEGELANRLPKLALPVSGNRYENAQKSVELLSAWQKLEGPDLVKALAVFDVPTSLPALARSMRTAQSLTQSLKERNWVLLEGVWSGTDSAGALIKSGVCRAIEADELAEPLAAALQKAESDATALLTAIKPPAPAPAPAPDQVAPVMPVVAPPGRVVLSTQNCKGLGVSEARTVLRDIESNLQEGATLDISYTVTAEEKP